MEKAVEIKRRAQRCVQNGDLDGALKEYEKLVSADGADPYNYVLIADLLYKKGDQQAAGDRYLHAAESYESAGLYKNGIAVCKKMMRLSLAPGTVLKRLGSLHAAAGLGAEASLYYIQYAEHMVRANGNEAAAEAFVKAYEAAPDNAKPLERAAEVLVLEDKVPAAASMLLRAAGGYTKLGRVDEAESCRKRALDLDPKATHSEAKASSSGEKPSAGSAPEPGLVAEPEAVDDAPDAGAKSDVADEGGVEADPVASEDTASSSSDESTKSAKATSGTAASEATGSKGEKSEAVTAIESAWEATQAASEAPGINFSTPAAADNGVNVQAILTEAQEHFKKGDRDAAADALSRAALAYEEAGNLDNAATIYRSLGKSAQVSIEVLTRWFENCKQRGDRPEAAHVACEIGDRCMVSGDRAEAHSWFVKATEYDETNDLAKRRLQRLSGQAADAEPVANGKAPEAAHRTSPHADAQDDEDQDELLGPEADEKPGRSKKPESGRVELAVGRGEAVTFDLGSLISEFQRGVDAQLSDDAQSHYDLAMAYREMGLLEQALDSFRIASNDPEYASRCAEMIGRCLLDQGRFEDAAQEFDTALRAGTLDAETQGSLRYQLGLAYEAAGRVEEALGEFEGVYAAQPNYPDVALKIRVLRKSLENI